MPLGQNRGLGAAATWSFISMSYIQDACKKLIGGGGSKYHIMGIYQFKEMLQK